MKEYDFSRDRFHVFQDDGGNWWVEDTETYDIYQMPTKNHAEQKAQAWSYEAAEIALNQFREGC